MEPYAIRQYGGIAPRIAPRLLPPAFAQRADNCKLLTGVLSAWQRPGEVAVAYKQGVIRSVYRLVVDGIEYWLNWNTDVDVVHEPIEGAADRIFWTGDGEPRMATFIQATVGPDYPTQFYVLGVYRPTVAPSVAPSGGSGADVSRAYVYTFVTASGEEGAPSPASAVQTGKEDGTWALSAMEVAPPNTGTVTAATHVSGVVTVELDTTRGMRAGEQIDISDVVGMTDLNGRHTIVSVVDGTDITVALDTAQTYTSGGEWDRVAAHNVQTRRIYRTVGGTEDADFFMVAEISAATTTYNDTLADSALGSIMESEDWEMPPATLSGLVSLGNQVLAGFDGKTMCFSEPGVPYAWPQRYRRTTPREIVAMFVYDNVTFILTVEEVWVAVGNTPESIALEPTNFRQPCLSKRGAVATPLGVLYPSPEGLCLVGPGGMGIASDSIMTVEQWAALNPSTMLGAFHQGMYFAWH